MCTMIELKAFFSKHFRGISKADVKPYVKISPFHIPATCKQLQYAAYMLVGDRCMSNPVQFPNPKLPNQLLHDWREGDYTFLFGSKLIFEAIPEAFMGLDQLSNFVEELPSRDYGKCITTPEQLIAHIVKESKIKDTVEVDTQEIQIIIKEGNQEKMNKGTKQRAADRLVFTYTNGATYTVRGLCKAQVEGMHVHYVAVTQDSEGNTTKLETTRRITNEISTVVVEIARAGNLMLVDLRPKCNKKVEKPARKRKSREEYEAERAQKEAKMAKLAKVEELLDEAAKLMN